MHRSRIQRNGEPGPAHRLRAIATGDWRIDSLGYVSKRNNQPDGGHRKYIAQHREVMEIYLGRELRKGENVHHKNGVKTDNRLSNLELWRVAQPAGQRVEDQVEWALETLRMYAPQALATEEGCKP